MFIYKRYDVFKKNDRMISGKTKQSEFPDRFDNLSIQKCFINVETLHATSLPILYLLSRIVLPTMICFFTYGMGIYRKLAPNSFW
jgi:hypothetical protein